ncbi:MAG: hypothetical protein L0H79_13395 [Intrasporangium sp.]|uniref:hypothetical protein n=1 Tax=Intrasporangium sp. TaxID=1925024 RepID=UPI002649CA02|nr:hypothetical protein [Intrasporangium sp.]MDN5796733.1 hypothetical protein [Intrasporangium sp.]
MSDRPRLKPWLRPIMRGGHEVQFGFADDGIIVTGVTPAEAGLLRSLDGSRSRAQTFGDARDAGVTVTRWRELLDLVVRLDLLEPEPRHPHVAPGRHVLVDGAGPLALEVGLLLGRLGVTRVTQGGTAVDLVLADPARDRPDLVLLVGAQALDPRCAEVWFHHRVPHLPVVPHGCAVSIGPVVGGEASSPCLWCVDLHRTDRDQAWGAVVHQLAGDQPQVTPGTHPPELLAPGAVPFVAGGVALLVLGVLSGQVPPVGLTLEVRAPWPRVDHRRWTRHPRCHHHGGEEVGVA